MFLKTLKENGNGFYLWELDLEAGDVVYRRGVKGQIRTWKRGELLWVSDECKSETQPVSTSFLPVYRKEEEDGLWE